MESVIWIAVASLAVNFIAVLLTNYRYAVKNTESRKRELLQLERSMHDAIETATRRFGETVSALREKTVQTELWNRDNFVDKESHRRLEDKIDRRFDATDRKLEKIINGHQS